MTVYPSILTESAETLQHQLDLSAGFEDLTAVQIDIIDGEFVDNQTVSLQTVVEADQHELPLDFHLMVNEPMDFVWELIEWKDELNIRTVIGQVERMSHPDQFLAEVKNQGWRAGLALDIYTPWDEIDPEVLRDVDVIQLLGNEVGRSGQPLNDLIWPKLKEIRAALADFHASSEAKAAGMKEPIELIIDIGVNLETAPKLLQAGVTGLAVTSALWKATDPEQMFRQLATIES